VIRRAASQSRVFRENSQSAQYNINKTFHHESLPCLSNVDPQIPKGSQGSCICICRFIQCVRPRLTQACRQQDFILNMDQTAIFTYHSSRTLGVAGSRTVNVRKSTCDTKRATFAMTITASGKVLRPARHWSIPSDTRYAAMAFTR
jgi:hypothetical protein